MVSIFVCLVMIMVVFQLVKDRIKIDDQTKAFLMGAALVAFIWLLWSGKLNKSKKDMGLQYWEDPPRNTSE